MTQEKGTEFIFKDELICGILGLKPNCKLAAQEEEEKKKMKKLMKDHGSKILNRLSRRDRDIIVLRFTKREGRACDVKTVADMWGVPEDSIREDEERILGEVSKLLKKY